MALTLFLILLAFSAFFSASETALFSLSRLELKKLEGRKNSVFANKVLQILAHPRDLLITILIGNTFVNIAASACFTSYALTRFGEKGLEISIACMTFLILIFGEVTPKTFSLNRAEGFSFFSAYPLSFIIVALKPLAIALRRLTDIMLNLLMPDFTEKSHAVTEDEIRSLIKIGRREGALEEGEKELIYGVFDIKDQKAADIMTPRIDVKALDFDNPQDETLREARSFKHSRLPVFRDTLDNIIGIAHTKDLLLNPHTNLKDLLKPCYFVPEQKRIDELLSDLQKRSTQMGVVVDEYGLVSGIITIEDILEEIVGEIKSKYESGMPPIEKLDEKTYRLSGKLHIGEANDNLGLDIKTDEVDTMGGFVLLLMGRIPEQGESVKYNQYTFKVTRVEDHRVAEILMTRD